MSLRVHPKWYQTGFRWLRLALTRYGFKRRLRRCKRRVIRPAYRGESHDASGTGLDGELGRGHKRVRRGAKPDGSVTDSCAMTPWRKGVHSSRAIASKALAGAHRTNYIDIQQVVKQSQPASMMTLDKLSPSFTGRIRISTVICYASNVNRA